MAGKLTTHVLDTAQGCPAADLVIELWLIYSSAQPQASSNKTLIKTIQTNADGRTDQPVLSSNEIQSGTYELVFAVGDYFAQQSVKTTDPPFLDRIPIQFTITDTNSHYHVPLLVSPWSYSTYRGS